MTLDHSQVQAVTKTGTGARGWSDLMGTPALPTYQALVFVMRNQTTTGENARLEARQRKRKTAADAQL